MKSIDSDIKEGRFKNIYFLMGVERYLIRQYRDKLVNALAGEDDGINVKRYSGEMPDINELIGFLDTVPFFAPRRVAVVEDTGIFKVSDSELADYLPSLPETSYIIFVESYKGGHDRGAEKKYEQTIVDKRYKLYKTVQKLGRTVEFKRMGRDILNKWLLKRFKDAGLNITRGAMELLYEYAGEDMSLLYNESEKLICYRLGHSSIDGDDVREVCSRNIGNDVFEMVRAIATKNRQKALKLYYDLLELRERPMGILSLITREFNILLKVKMLRDAGKNYESIEKVAGINKYFVGKYVNISSRFTYEYLKEAVTECIDTETLFKQGRINDLIAVEMLIVKYAS